jgi:glycosyltransferase involved in cell wall biosynthesis
MSEGQNEASPRRAGENSLPIRVYFDSQIFHLQRYGGISNYFNNLIDTFIQNPDLGIVPMVQSSRFLNETAATRVGRKPIRAKLKVFIYAFFYLNGWMTRIPENADIVHRTYYSRVFQWGDKPNVTTLFDMIPETTGALWPNPHLSKKYVLSASAAVVSISQSALDYCEAIWKWRPNIASVAHLAANIPQVDFEKASPVPNPFLLFVGQRSLYKRGEWAIRAASLLPPDWLVVFAGPKFSDKEKKLVASLGVESQILCLQPSDQDLVHLYRHALVLLHISETEGFGLPILEAMSQETPVILGRNAINHEVAGDLGLYFENTSLQDFLEVVESYIQRPLKVEGSEFGKKLRQHAESFTWKECARLTALAYRAALGEGPKNQSRLNNA